MADEEGIVGAADELRDLRVQVEPVQADLTVAADVDRLWERIRARGRPLEAIALNAVSAWPGRSWTTISRKRSSSFS